MISPSQLTPTLQKPTTINGMMHQLPNPRSAQQEAKRQNFSVVKNKPRAKRPRSGPT